MSEDRPDIVIADRRIDPAELDRLPRLFFEDMVKYVVDIERRVAAIRPAQGNRSMEIEDPRIRDLVREITFSLIGEGEARG